MESENEIHSKFLLNRFSALPKRENFSKQKKTESKFALRLVAGEGIEPPAFGL